jgi:hypothetical protein
VPSDVSSLDGLCSALLAACVAALATTDAGVPERQFVSAGQPAFDCGDFVAVQSLTLGLADTQPLQPMLQPAQRVHSVSLNLTTLIAYAIRCVPTLDTRGNPPTAAALTAAARVTNQDGFAIWNHLKRTVRDGSLFPGCRTPVFFDGGLSLVPSGARAGWQFTLRVEIEGIAV